MQETLRTIRAKRADDDDRGFTLIELLVVVVIIGVLVAIAIPLYLNYRKGAENKSAASDVRGAVSAAEQYYTENSNAYPTTQIGALGGNVVFDGTSPQTATVSSGNTLSFKNNTTSYVICGQNTNGKTIYVYNSANGGAVAKSNQDTLALCVAAGT
jgi:type IV pilus assembly protein PilA